MHCRRNAEGVKKLAKVGYKMIFLRECDEDDCKISFDIMILKRNLDVVYDFW